MVKNNCEAEEISTITFSPIIGNQPSIKIDSFGEIYIGITYMDTVIIDGQNYIANSEVPSYNSVGVLKFTNDGVFVDNIVQTL